MQIEQNGLSYSLTEKVYVRFLEEQDKQIMNAVVDHLSENAVNYKVVDIPKDKLRRIVELGLQSYAQEQYRIKKSST